MLNDFMSDTVPNTTGRCQHAREPVPPGGKAGLRLVASGDLAADLLSAPAPDRLPLITLRFRLAALLGEDIFYDDVSDAIQKDEEFEDDGKRQV